MRSLRRTAQLQRLVARHTEAPAGPDLPVHFFTIVLNGEPFIRYHLDVFCRLPFPWHWHVVEGVASLAHDTGWSVEAGGRIDPAAHAGGLSVDGTTAYLDAISNDAEHVTVYRRPDGAFWDGKRDMASAPLANIRDECLLWQVDADELWTVEQIVSVRELFLASPERTAAYYWCHFVPAPGAIVTTRYNYAANPAVDWLRTWRYRPGDRWKSHEPPTLVRRGRDGEIDVAVVDPFLHEETEDVGAVFQHFAYATEAQVRFKEHYYGYAGAVESWRALREALQTEDGPLRLGDYLPWVSDDTLVEVARRVPLLACEGVDGSWSFAEAMPIRPTTTTPTREGPIVVDGVFFQHGLTSGIARVWRSLLEEWLRTGFAKRLVFLDRGGAGPRLAGLSTRSVPPWRGECSARDSLRLERVCDEERAALFVSSYYTTPIATASLMLVYDLIPERLELGAGDPVWDEKRRAIEHASAYACISESTRRDLLELVPDARGKPIALVPLGIGDFTTRPPEEVAAFRRRHGLDRPYFLVVGERKGVGGYKNVGLVFRALATWRETDAHELVCVGGKPEIEPTLRRLAPDVRARRLSLGDDELRLAYAGAVALLFPSRYEGFGLPVAEAMACGCPVVTTPVASLPEVAGDAAIYVDPDDPQALRDALDAVRDPLRRAAMIEAGARRARDLRWADAASAFAAALSEAAASDTTDRRQARAAAWGQRRQAQDRQQTVESTRGSEEGVLGSSRLPRGETRLRSIVRHHLPDRALTLLRTSKVSMQRRSERRRPRSGTE